jgi:hypothetical protein
MTTQSLQKLIDQAYQTRTYHTDILPAAIERVDRRYEHGANY